MNDEVMEFRVPDNVMYAMSAAEQEDARRNLLELADKLGVYISEHRDELRRESVFWVQRGASLGSSIFSMQRLLKGAPR